MYDEIQCACDFHVLRPIRCSCTTKFNSAEQIEDMFFSVAKTDIALEAIGLTVNHTITLDIADMSVCHELR